MKGFCFWQQKARIILQLILQKLSRNKKRVCLMREWFLQFSFHVFTNLSWNIHWINGNNIHFTHRLARCLYSPLGARLCLMPFRPLSKHLEHFSNYRLSTLVMPSKPKWSVYSVLHDDVSRLLEENDLHFDFHENDDTKSCINEYDTNIMGRFICGNRSCGSSGWSSKKIAITIRMYTGAQYNARVYHQRCQKCNGLSKPRLDDSYAERVAYRLKKCCGVEMDRSNYSGRSKGPHQSSLCEGCKDGHCSQL